MTNTVKALLWAVLIIAVAFVMQGQGMSDNASMGVVAGLTGAAWGSLKVEGGCGRNCLQ